MIKIRRSTFETNSSSMHSLVLLSNDDMATDEEVRKDFVERMVKVDGRLYLKIEPKSFNSGPEIVLDPYQKCLYLLAGTGNDVKKILKIRDAIGLRLADIDLKLADDFAGFIFPENDYYSFSKDRGELMKGLLEASYSPNSFEAGDIDHQSASLPREAIASINVNPVISIRDIIFSKRYVFTVQSDGDDNFVLSNIKSGMYKKDCYKAILSNFYPIHKFKDPMTGKMLVGCDYEHYFPTWEDIDSALKTYDED